MRVIHRFGQAMLAVVLTLSLLVAPIAWAASPAQGANGWLNQLWDLVAAWIAPVERGPAADPDGLEATSLEATSQGDTTTSEPWAEPMPLDPTATDTSNDDGDSGPTADPHG